MNDWIPKLSSTATPLAAAASPAYYISQGYPLFVVRLDNRGGRIIGWRVQDGHARALVFWEGDPDRGPSLLSEEDMATAGFGEDYAVAGNACRGVRDGY